MISAPCAAAAAVLSAIAIEYTRQKISPEMIVLCLLLIAFVSSVGRILFGVLKIGRLMRYMPYTVVSGYLSGVGLIVILSQIPKWLATPKGTNWWQSLNSPDLWQLPSLLIGLSTGLAMIYGPKLTHKIPADIIGLTGGIVTYWLLALSQWPVLLNIENNPFVIGHLSADINGMVDSIQGTWQSLLANSLQRWDQILVPAITLAVLLSIDTLKTCLVLDALTRSRRDSNKELIGQRPGNLTSTLLGGAPGAGTMGATLANKASGGETFLSVVFQGI
ncbi:MAG: SulP family inorganic anion transporter [Limnohabitans sp.]|nr:SulP family inorganic anion transporter [Limnohabitans sp.]